MKEPTDQTMLEPRKVLSLDEIAMSLLATLETPTRSFERDKETILKALNTVKQQTIKEQKCPLP